MQTEHVSSNYAMLLLNAHRIQNITKTYSPIFYCCIVTLFFFSILILYSLFYTIHECCWCMCYSPVSNLWRCVCIVRLHVAFVQPLQMQFGTAGVYACDCIPVSVCGTWRVMKSNGEFRSFNVNTTIQCKAYSLNAWKHGKAIYHSKLRGVLYHNEASKRAFHLYLLPFVPLRCCCFLFFAQLLRCACTISFNLIRFIFLPLSISLSLSSPLSSSLPPTIRLTKSHGFHRWIEWL